MNKILEDRFQLISCIGEGGMGQVFKVVDRSNQRTCALKVSNIPFEKSDRERLVKECSIWFELRHIGQVVEVYEILSNDFGEFMILMEYVEGGDLQTRISDRQFGIEDRILALYDIACALLKCNQEIPGFAHLDIKPSNCLITFHKLTKLSDFGLATNNLVNISDNSNTTKITNCHNSMIIKSNKGRFIVGTPLYMAPEQILGRCDNGAKADIYSLGIMALELLSGRHPINTTDIHMIFKSHLMGIPKHNRAWPLEVPSKIVKILNSCLETHPNNRPQIDELVKVLRTAFSSSVYYETDIKRLPDPVDDAMRKAHSLWTLGQRKTSLSLMLKTLEDDPFQPDCWIQAAKWKLEISKRPLDDSCRKEVVNWCLRASCLSYKSDEKRKQEILEIIMPLTYDENPCPAHIFSERLEKMIQEQKAWLETREKRLIEDGGSNRSLCVRCGEVRTFIIQRCPKCGFFPKDMRDIYNTNLLRVSNVNPHKNLPYHERMILLRKLGKDINTTITQIKSPPDYDKTLREFKLGLGKLLQAIALGSEYNEIYKIWRDTNGIKAPDRKEMKKFVSHFAKLSEGVVSNKSNLTKLFSFPIISSFLNRWRNRRS
ncbi:MAG: serine/threonine-protein kinase [Planctomycetota bacterium]